MKVGKECSLCSRTDNLGRWPSNVPKTIFPVQAKLESFKGEVLKTGEAGAQFVICRHDPELICWYQWQLFSNVIRCYLLGKFGLSLPKASGLQISRKFRLVWLQTKGLRSASKECISLRQVNP